MWGRQSIGPGQPCDMQAGQHTPQALQDKWDWNPFVGLSNAAQETIEGLWGRAGNLLQLPISCC